MRVLTSLFLILFATGGLLVTRGTAQMGGCNFTHAVTRSCPTSPCTNIKACPGGRKFKECDDDNFFTVCEGTELRLLIFAK